MLLHSFDYYLSILLTLVTVPPGVETDFCVCDSFEDLVLCGFDEAEGPNGEFGRTFFIYNPFTKLWVALPLAPTRPEGYFQMEARLVCEPRQSIDLDLVVYSEYRFRVVCMYLLRQSIYLDVFCSESREWTSRALVLDGFLRLRDPHLISWNGDVGSSLCKPEDT
ncbi:unnamed protein product [Linum tenue]|uniref:Uncharacterized protein n=1 Tax=Linum tenue TaxID=586396 RepID=A0AAV0RKH9_9ROSI|nr:unnamed protein product [Linum tenue]